MAWGTPAVSSGGQEPHMRHAHREVAAQSRRAFGVCLYSVCFSSSNLSVCAAFSGALADAVMGLKRKQG